MAPVADVRPCAIYLQGLCPFHLHRCSREACRKFPHTCFLHEDVSDRSTSLACSNSYDEQTVDKDLSSKYSAHKCDHSRSLHPVFSSKAELNLVAPCSKYISPTLTVVQTILSVFVVQAHAAVYTQICILQMGVCIFSI